MKTVDSVLWEEGRPARGRDGEVGCDHLFQEQMTILKDDEECASDEEAGRRKALPGRWYNLRRER